MIRATHAANFITIFAIVQKLQPFEPRSSFLTKPVDCNFNVKITENAPYGRANGLSCVMYYTKTLSKIHVKAGQHNAEIKDHFVDDTMICFTIQ